MSSTWAREEGAAAEALPRAASLLGTKVIADNTGVWHACGLLGSKCFMVVPPARGRADSLCVLNDGVGRFPEESWGNLPCHVKPLRTLWEASVPPTSFRSDLRGG